MCVLEGDGGKEGGVHRSVTANEMGRTWKKPGGMGPPGMASLGGMLPITGLGAAAALWKRKKSQKTNDDC